MTRDSNNQPSGSQRITRLTPLDTVVTLIESHVGTAKPRRRAIGSALGLVLAEDVLALGWPSLPIALYDGLAVEASALADAGPYSPVVLKTKPSSITVGEALPAGTDAVASFDAVREVGDHVEAIGAISPGEGVLPAGADAAPNSVLRRTGHRLRALDITIMAATGIIEAMVCEPRIRIACGSAAKTPIVDAALAMLANFVRKMGGAVSNEPMSLPDALMDEQADAVIAVGGTGGGRNDSSVRNLARLGRVEAHGIAISPGETTAFGFVNEKPVLLLPGRIDAMLAGWLLIGVPLITCLSGRNDADLAVKTLTLKRKVTSTIGLVDLIPVRRVGLMVEPLASSYLSLESLVHSDGWIVIPAGNEGMQAGTPVAMISWP